MPCQSGYCTESSRKVFFLLNASGGVIDDLIVYRLAESVFLIVSNASGVASVVSHLMDRLPNQM